MYTPKGNHEDRPLKRMRLGTKSCAECRKRKIRCKLPPESSICEYCAAHDVRCTPQQPKEEHNDTEMDLKRKIEDLQGMVSRICKVIDLDVVSSSLADFETGTMEALKRLKHVPTPESNVGESLTSRNSGHRNSEDLGMSSVEPTSFDNAPLLSLFKEAMSIESDSSRSDVGVLVMPADQGIDSCIKSLCSILPTEADLDLIFGLTERYWFIWKGFEDINTEIDGTKAFGVAHSKRLILDSVQSGSPIKISKAVLNLALCIQQLPRTFEYRRTNLSAAPADLLKSYAAAVVILMLSESGTLDELDCCLLQYKLYINMGKPRKAWLCNRRAISLATLLGLHHPEGRTNARRTSLWLHIWQVDRILSVSLGVPYTIQASSVDLSMRGDSVEEQVMYDVCVLAGRVIDRDQSRPTVEYSITEEIEQDFQRCIARMPADWWKWKPDSTTPLNMVYWISSIKAQFFLVRKLLHLPYMLKATTKKRYDKSRIVALESSRGLIECFQDVRNYSGDAVIICDLMDFQAFSAALTITIDLLSPNAQDCVQGDEDWKLVNETSVTLRRVSESLECHVAAQAVRLLDLLYKIHQGAFIERAEYEARIPYFGRVRIRERKMPQTDQTEESNPSPNSSSFLGTVEFCTNAFEYDFKGSFLGDAELGVDWTSPFEIDADFDWSQMYEAALTWEQ